MALKTVHDSIDDIPEQYRDLYTEKGGKFELTGIAGIKTQADLERVQSSASKYQTELGELANKFKPWSELDYDETMAKLDRIPELEAAAAGKLDEAGIEEIVTKRVSGTINSKTAPLERQLSTLAQENESLKEENFKYRESNRQRKINDNLTKALTAAKVLPQAMEDALLLGERMFEIREDDGAIVTKDQVGVTPGVTADLWLTEIQEKKTHWWPTNVGGNAPGSGSSGGVGENPWTAEHWNMTKQAQYETKNGRVKAEQMAKMAGTRLGGLKPKPKK